MYAMKNGEKDEYFLLHEEDGAPVTRLDAEHHPIIYPLHSNLGAFYEHPEGLILDHASVKILGVPIEE